MPAVVVRRPPVSLRLHSGNSSENSRSHPRCGMKKLAWGVVTSIAALPLAFLGRAAVTGGQDREPRPEVVRVARRAMGSTVKATGVVKPRIGAEVRVGSRVSGVVARLHVRIGDT